MKRLVVMMLVGIAGFMLLVASPGYCDPWKHNPPGARYGVVRDHSPRHYRPEPVRYHRENVRYVERREEGRSGQVAVAVLGGVVIGTLLGTVIAQGR